MHKTLKYIDKNISYKVQGKGTPVVFLHGYLESLKIWDSFLSEFECGYQLISIDIPGHGKSDTFGNVHTMEFLAETVIAILDHLDIKKAFIIGHSMGGYATLALIEDYYHKVLGFCLFHSHPYADTDETRQKRKREIQLVKEGKKDLIAQVNIPNAFADQNLENYKDEANRSIEIAVQTPSEGIVANLNGMMNRPDRSDILANTELPFLLIAGKNDNYIPFDVARSIHLPLHGKIEVLESSGHMGFIEESEKAKKIIIDFITLHTNH